MKTIRKRIIGISFLATAALVVAQAGVIGFGVKDSEVKARLVDAVWYGNMPVYPSAKLYYAGTTSARVAFVKAFFSTARAYSQIRGFQGRI